MNEQMVQLILDTIKVGGNTAVWIIVLLVVKDLLKIGIVMLGIGWVWRSACRMFETKQVK
jgi:hypothetical protein